MINGVHPVRAQQASAAASLDLAAERLEARDLRVYFSGVKALDGVDLTLEKGELLGLIGPNGAGKTTLVNVLSGFQRPTTGTVSLAGTEITRLPPHRIASLGLTRTFQGLHMFERLSVAENVEAAAVGAGLNRGQARQRARDLLARMDLAERAAELPGSLSPGIERQLGILRALATAPRFLLLDEPAAGMNETETDELLARISVIRDDFSCGVLVIEHDMRLIMRLCERIQVLDYGKTISIGTADEVRADPAVISAYLGTSASTGAKSS